MDNFEKPRRYLQSDMLVLLFISFIVLPKMLNLFNVAYTIFLLFIYIQARRGKKSAGICGIIVGILMISTILQGDILDMVLGIFVLVHSIKYIKNFK